MYTNDSVRGNRADWPLLLPPPSPSPHAKKQFKIPYKWQPLNVRAKVYLSDRKKITFQVNDEWWLVSDCFLTHCTQCKSAILFPFAFAHRKSDKIFNWFWQSQLYLFSSSQMNIPSQKCDFNPMNLAVGLRMHCQSFGSHLIWVCQLIYIICACEKPRSKQIVALTFAKYTYSMSSSTHTHTCTPYHSILQSAIHF